MGLKRSKSACKITLNRTLLVATLEALLAEASSSGQLPFEIVPSNKFSITKRLRIVTKVTPAIHSLMKKHGIPAEVSMNIELAAQFFTMTAQKVAQTTAPVQPTEPVIPAEPVKTVPLTLIPSKKSNLNWVGNPGLQLAKTIAGCLQEIGVVNEEEQYTVTQDILPEVAASLGQKHTMESIQKEAKEQGREITPNLLKQRADRAVRYSEWPENHQAVKALVHLLFKQRYMIKGSSATPFAVK